MGACVWICQCLCPQRHAILAVAGEAQTEEDAQVLRNLLVGGIAKLADVGLIAPWCGRCNAKIETWIYEVVRTRFRTMEEACHDLRQGE